MAAKTFTQTLFIRVIWNFARVHVCVPIRYVWTIVSHVGGVYPEFAIPRKCVQLMDRRMNIRLFEYLSVLIEKLKSYFPKIWTNIHTIMGNCHRKLYRKTNNNKIDAPALFLETLHSISYSTSIRFELSGIFVI